MLKENTQRFYDHFYRTFKLNHRIVKLQHIPSYVIVDKKLKTAPGDGHHAQSCVELTATKFTLDNTQTFLQISSKKSESKCRTQQQPRLNAKSTDKLNTARKSRKSIRNEKACGWLERLRTVVENCEQIKQNRGNSSENANCGEDHVLDLSCQTAKQTMECNNVIDLSIDRPIVGFGAEYRLKFYNPFRSQNVPSYVPKVATKCATPVENLADKSKCPEIVMKPVVTILKTLNSEDKTKCPQIIVPIVNTVLNDENKLTRLKKVGSWPRENCCRVARKRCPVKSTTKQLVDTVSQNENKSTRLKKNVSWSSENSCRVVRKRCPIKFSTKRSSRIRIVNQTFKSMRRSPVRVVIVVCSVLLSLALFVLCLSMPTVYCPTEKNDVESNGNDLDYLLNFIQMLIVSN